MRITWVTRSFADYRIPVYEELNKLCGHQLTVIYYNDAVKPTVQEKLKKVIGDRAISISKEIRIGNGKKLDNASTMKRTFRIPLSPGLIKKVKSTQPDVLISDGFMQWTYAPLFVRATKKIPHVMCYERTAHTERNATRIRIAYRRFVSRWIDAIDCNGSLCGAYVKDLLGWGDERLTYGHMVADVKGMAKKVAQLTTTQVEELRQRYAIRGTMLLYVGQIIDRKGVKELLKAWKQFKEQRQDECTLVLVGKGWQEEELKAYIKNQDIKDVVFTGAIAYEQTSLFYKAADCFILPTLEDNWSLVVPEAMACGLPIATSIYNGCYPELVQQSNGWVFDPKDHNSIVATLKEIMKHKDELKQMGEASLEIVAHHTAEDAAAGIFKAIETSKGNT